MNQKAARPFGDFLFQAFVWQRENCRPERWSSLPGLLLLKHRAHRQVLQACTCTHTPLPSPLTAFLFLPTQEIFTCHEMFCLLFIIMDPHIWGRMWGLTFMFRIIVIIANIQDSNLEPPSHTALSMCHYNSRKELLLLKLSLCLGLPWCSND